MWENVHAEQPRRPREMKSKELEIRAYTSYNSLQPTSGSLQWAGHIDYYVYEQSIGSSNYRNCFNLSFQGASRSVYSMFEERAESVYYQQWYYIKTFLDSDVAFDSKCNKESRQIRPMNT